MRLIALLSLLSWTSVAAADERPTVQSRFGIKEGTLSGHLLAVTPIRDDFYKHAGFGGALAYYPWERFGIELRGMGYVSWLSPTAQQIQAQTGYIPDTRPRRAAALIGGRLSLGYGKVQVGQAFVVHFDPQLVVQGGVTFGVERRLLPTVAGGLGLLLHFRHRIQVQIDLLALLEVENRGNRGTVAAISFAPTLSLGWALGVGAGS